MIQENKILILVDKLKEFEEKKKDILPYINKDIFDSDSEDFYLNENTSLQIFIYDLIFKLEELFLDKDLNVVEKNIAQINKTKFIISKFDPEYSYKVKMSFCDIVF